MNPSYSISQILNRFTGCKIISYHMIKKKNNNLWASRKSLNVDLYLREDYKGEQNDQNVSSVNVDLSVMINMQFLRLHMVWFMLAQKGCFCPSISGSAVLQD